MENVENMSCERFQIALNDEMDQCLTPQTEELMRAHARECADCARAWVVMKAIQDASAQWCPPCVEPPLPAQAAWRKAVRREHAAQRRRKRSIRATSIAAAFLALWVGITVVFERTGRLWPSNENAAYDVGYGSVEETFDPDTSLFLAMTDESMALDAPSDGVPPQSRRSMTVPEVAMPSAVLTEGMKMLQSDGIEDTSGQTGEVGVHSLEANDEASSSEGASAPLSLALSASLVIETDRFEVECATLSDLVSEFDGYYAYQSVQNEKSGRVGTYTLSIPVQSYEAFLSAVTPLGMTTSEVRNATPVGMYYYDAQSRLDTLSATRDRLNALLLDATDAEAIRALRLQLDEVYSSIDFLTQDIYTYDLEANYAKVDLTLMEKTAVLLPTPEPSLGERTHSGFTQSLISMGDFFEDMIVSLSVIAPATIIVLLLCAAFFGVSFVIRRKKRHGEVEMDGE